LHIGSFGRSHWGCSDVVFFLFVGSRGVGFSGAQARSKHDENDIHMNHQEYRTKSGLLGDAREGGRATEKKKRKGKVRKILRGSGYGGLDINQHGHYAEHFWKRYKGGKIREKWRRRMDTVSG